MLIIKNINWKPQKTMQKMILYAVCMIIYRYIYATGHWIMRFMERERCLWRVYSQECLVFWRSVGTKRQRFGWNQGLKRLGGRNGHGVLGLRVIGGLWGLWLRLLRLGLQLVLILQAFLRVRSRCPCWRLWRWPLCPCSTTCMPHAKASV